VEADGVMLADLDRPVRQVQVAAGGGGDGLADVVVRPDTPDNTAIRARARSVTVSGADFRYRADTLVRGPVRTRTWTVQPGGWALTLPR
jgi:hypothetical protein